MYFRTIICIFLLAILMSVHAIPLTVLVPTQDSFYIPPEGFERYSNGHILKLRKTPHPLRRAKQQINIKNSWQAMVRSSDSYGAATTIVTTIMEPYNADPEKVVSYQIFENSACIDCPPSYGLQLGANETTLTELNEMYFIEIALNKGWFVVTPDYEGPKAAFSASIQEGQATLDSIRAVLKSSNTTGISSHAKVAMWGYSGGTIPTTWAAALQPTYASELKANLVGAAFGGLVSNISSTAELLDGGIHVGLTVAAVAGLANEYPDFKEVIMNDIFPNKTDQFNEIYKLCMTPEGPYDSEQKIFSGPERYFKSGWDILKDPVVLNVLNKNILGLNKDHGIPDIPLFLYHGEKDQMASIEQAQRVYDNWCDWGIGSFEFAADASVGHHLAALTGLGAAMEWLNKRLEGEIPIQGCSKIVRKSNAFYPGIEKSVFDFITSTAKSWFGIRIGPSGLSPALGDTGRTASVITNNGSVVVDQAYIDKINW